MKTLYRIHILILSLFISSCDMSSIEDMKTTIDQKSTEIMDLKAYFTEIVPENYIIRIQYNSHKNIDLFVYAPIGTTQKRETLFGQWNVNLNSYKAANQTEYEKTHHGKTNSLEEVKEKLHWNRETFNTLYDKLENANCVGISNRNPIQVEYGYSGMALLSFSVFDEDLTPEQQAVYSDGCMTLFYKKNIVLRYGSGAEGGQCTEGFQRNN